MITNWTLFIIFSLLTLLSFYCALQNIIDYIMNGGGKYRFLYMVAGLWMAYFASIFADKIF